MLFLKKNGQKLLYVDTVKGSSTKYQKVIFTQVLFLLLFHKKIFCTFKAAVT